MRWTRSLQRCLLMKLTMHWASRLELEGKCSQWCAAAFPGNDNDGVWSCTLNSHEESVIRKAYFKKAQKYHPDKNPDGRVSALWPC